MPKRYPPKLKFQVVLEVLAGEKSAGQAAKIYGVHPNSVKPITSIVIGLVFYGIYTLGARLG